MFKEPAKYTKVMPRATALKDPDNAIRRSGMSTAADGDSATAAIRKNGQEPSAVVSQNFCPSRQADVVF
jgi:hypothetical protein